jgi:hypothetical protein
METMMPFRQTIAVVAIALAALLGHWVAHFDTAEADARLVEAFHRPIHTS